MGRKKRRIAKSGYTGVYKNVNGNQYTFHSFLTSDPYRQGRHIEGGFKSAEEAYEAKMIYEARVKHQNAISYNANRFGFLVEKYLDWKKNQVKISTYHHLFLLINKYLFPKYRDYSINEFCEYSHLDNFRKSILSKPVSIRQKNKILRMVCDIFKLGGLMNYVKMELVNQVFVKMTKIADPGTSVKEHHENYWSTDEWKKFLNSIDPNERWYVFFSLYGQLGCRIGEIRGLQNKHVNLIEQTITIEQQALSNTGSGKTIISTPKTKSGVRVVTITPKMCNMLDAFMKAHHSNSKEKFLFFNQKEPLGTSTIRRAFDFYIKKAGLPHITLHGIRHSNCTWLLSDNLTPQEVGQISERLGHASVKETLDIYMHIHKIENPIIIKKLDDLV